MHACNHTDLQQTAVDLIPQVALFVIIGLLFTEIKTQMKISNYIEKWKYKIICSLSGFPSTSGKNKTQANKQSYYEQGQLYGV